MQKNHSGNTKLLLCSICEHQYKLDLAAALYLPEGSALCREDERERRDKVGYLIRRFSQLGKG